MKLILLFANTWLGKRYFGFRRKDLEIVSLTDSSVHYRLGKNRFLAQSFTAPVFGRKLRTLKKYLTLPFVVPILNFMPASAGLVALLLFVPLTVDKFVTSDDTYVFATQPNTNFGGATIMDVRWSHSNTRIGYALLKADLSPLAGATINSAVLNIYAQSASELVATQIHCDRITTPWTENTVTWNNRPTTTTSGRVSIPVGLFPDWKLWTITQFVSDWVAGVNDNFGIQISVPQYTGGQNNQINFRSSDYADPNFHPYIEVDYTAPIRGRIAGNVTLSGNGVEGATVRCIRQSDNTAIAAQTTDVNGGYEFTGLELEELYHLAVEYEAGGKKYNALSKWDIVPEEVA